MVHSIRRSGLWLVACLLVCVVVAVVRFEPPTSQSPDIADGSAALRDLPTDVQSVILSLREQSGLDWRAISVIEAPWGRDVRLRPHHRSVEIRGVDVRILRDGRLVFEQPQYDGDRLRREAERLEGIIEVGSAAGHGSSSTDAGSIGPISPGTASPSAVLLVSGNEIDYAYETIVSPSPDRSRFQSGSAPTGSPVATVAEVVARLGPRFEGAEFVASLPLPRDASVPLRVHLDPETGEAIRVLDLRRGAEGQAHIFDPNPITTSGRTELRDGDPVDQYRLWVPLERLEQGGRLRGEWVRVNSDLGPAAHEPGYVFDFVSTDPRFEQAMAYYHADRSLERAEELGFEGLFPAPIPIVVHGTRLDNSWYSPPTREIVYGSGGVDDAEDADIILHETGHAIHDALVPGFGGGDTRAISEGFADFWAASLTDDACVGDWDATSYGPPCLRRVDDDVVYPNSITGNVHRDGRVWSALLWDIRTELGPELGEQLALAALREQSWNSSWEDAAQALLRAADRLGLRRSQIDTHLARRGFLSRILSVDLQGDETARVELPRPASFLGTAALAIDLNAQGEVRFVDTRSADPGASPWFVPYAPEEPGEFSLGGRGEMDGNTLVLDFTWSDADGAVVLRSRTEWDTVDGDLSWCLLDYDASPLLTRADPVRFWSGGGNGDATLHSIDWGSEAQEWTRLAGFRGTHPGQLTDRIGERWQLESNGDGEFSILRESYGRTLVDVPQLYAQPSPFRANTEIRLYVPSSRNVSVTIHGADGRLLRRLGQERMERGLRIWDWDGRDDRGWDLASGRYWIRAGGEGTDEVISIVRIR